MPLTEQLSALRRRASALPTLAELFAADPERATRFVTGVGPLQLDYSRQALDPALRDGLLDLAAASHLPQRLSAMWRGDVVNVSETRPALHPWLRLPAAEAPESLRGIVAGIAATRQRCAQLVAAIHAGRAAEHGLVQPRDVVSIGIGGSDLGPRLVADALPAAATAPTVHFLANVDGHALARLLPRLEPQQTLVLVVSKSFATPETRRNAEALRQFLLSGGVAEADLGRHLIAVSSRPERAIAFGVRPDRVLPMDDAIGGRFSLWGPVGLGAALAIGWPAFAAMLEGAAAIDRHLLSAPMGDNLPVLAGLIGFLNRNVHRHPVQAVLAYDERLRLLPDYLQQLRMESNGKGVDESGSALAVDGAAALFGGLGTPAQHAFLQALHQGTLPVPVEFVACLRPDHPYLEHHRILLANLLAQAAALMHGRQDPAPEKCHPGNRPSSLLWIDRLNPGSLGALLAFYEHQTVVEGMLCGLDPFDQWGVERGKEIAEGLATALAGGKDPADCDSATSRSLAMIRAALD